MTTNPCTARTGWQPHTVSMPISATMLRKADHVLGACSQSMPIVTAYDTLGEEGLKHSLMQTNAKAIFLDPHLLTKLINPLKEAKDIQHVIYNSDGEAKQGDIQKLKDAHPHLTIQSFDEFVKLGEENPADPVPPQPEDLCCIMYTSGSTGTPKGVLLKHRNVVAAGKSTTVHFAQFLANNSSCWCGCHCRSIPRSWRWSSDLSSPRAHSRVRLRKRNPLLGWYHGLR